MYKKDEVILPSLESFISYAKAFSKKLKPGDIVILSGDLGVGKTTFVKVVCAELGVEKVVTSPTFTFMKSYKSNIGTIYHYDLYRVSSEDEIFELGIEDNLYGDGISFIEWNKFANLKANYIISISKIDDTNGRSVEIEYEVSCD